MHCADRRRATHIRFRNSQHTHDHVVQFGLPDGFHQLRCDAQIFSALLENGAGEQGRCHTASIGCACMNIAAWSKTGADPEKLQAAAKWKIYHDMKAGDGWDLLVQGSNGQQVQDFEAAGAFAVEMEVVAANLATEITRRTSMLTISLGSGGGCDAQYLFSADLLGENRGHIPRHAKTYRNFAAERDRLQRERVAAYKEYIDDVATGAFPEAGHTVLVDDEVLTAVWG